MLSARYFFQILVMSKLFHYGIWGLTEIDSHLVYLDAWIEHMALKKESLATKMS